MPGAATSTQLLLARLAIVLVVGLLLLGAFWYGFSAEVHQRVWHHVAERPGGPMTFRFILQPCMAAIAAFHDGAQDARSNRPPYLRVLLAGSQDRAASLFEALIATARIILLGLGMDAIYQATVLGTFYPGEAVLMALLLAFVPYLLLRGPFARLVRRWDDRRSGGTRSER
jgi:hypothetical protein